jgi:hypothetical protein
LESKPNGQWWFPTLFLFVAILGTIAQVTTWRFILFPPLIVMAYEMLGHPDTCPWAKPPFTFPAVCFLAALSGVEAKHWLHGTPLAATLVLIFTLALLRVARLRMPPALAIGLIPFVMPSPTVAYALSVAGGTLALTAWFMLYRRWPGSQPPSNPPHPGTTEPCRNVSQTRFPTLTC